MDSLQDQILALNAKVDGLYETMERLPLQVSDMLGQHRPIAPQAPIEADFASANSQLIDDRQQDWNGLMEHKDVLGDGARRDLGNASAEVEIAPEVQIQRLTAQLTAAYNRIAALEEQLLSRTDSARRNGHLARLPRE